MKLFDNAKYQLLGKIKDGGMGSLYQVRHRHIDELRVIKLIRPRHAENEKIQKRFRLEAKTALSLQHPNIVKFYDFDVHGDGTAQIVMEYLRGKTVEELLFEHGPLDLELALEIAVESLQALNYLHAQGYVHRDIAPDNLMLIWHDDRPRVKLIDLGIAKAVDEDEDITLTAPGQFVGKARYASPEHFDEYHSPDQRSDIYSFGVMLYEVLTGARPFPGGNFRELRESHLHAAPRGFSETDPHGKIPEEVRAIILRALEKDPQKRIQTAAELARLLTACQGSLGPDGWNRYRHLLEPLTVSAPEVTATPADTTLDQRPGQQPSPKAPKKRREIPATLLGEGSDFELDQRWRIPILILLGLVVTLLVLWFKSRLPPPRLDASAAVINDSRPELTWEPIAKARYYHLHISHYEDFDGLVVDQRVSEPRHQLEEPLDEGRYFWRVASERQVGSLGEFSEVREIVIDLTPPAVPFITPRRYRARSPRPQFTWKIAEDATGYRIQVASRPDFIAPLIDRELAAQLIYVPDEDLPEGEVFWRVSSLDTAGNESAFSAIDVFRIDHTAPSAPRLVRFGGRSVSEQQPRLEWRGGYGVVYRVHIARTDSFAAPILDQETPKPFLTLRLNLPEGEIFWRVASRDAAGNESDFSRPDRLIVDVTPPAVPRLVPVEPDPLNDPHPRLAWNGAEGALGYRLQIATEEAGFQTPLVDQLLRQRVFPCTKALPEGRIFWRVASRDAAGNESKPSPPESFIVDVTAPDVPVLVPIDGALTRLLQPELRWQEAAGAEGYHLQIARDDTFAELLFDRELTGARFRPGADLPEGEICWRVAGVDAAGNRSAFSPHGLFEIDRTAPGIPELVAVEPNPTRDPTPELRWRDVAGADAYRVQVSADPAFRTADVVLDETASAHRLIPAARLPEGVLFWRAASRDRAGNESEFSRSSRLRLDRTPPPVPELVPAEIGGPRPQLLWSTVEDAHAYRIQLSRSSGFESFLMDALVGEPSFSPPADLPEGTTWWRVSSRDATGNESAFSAAGEIVVVAATWEEPDGS